MSYGLIICLLYFLVMYQFCVPSGFWDTMWLQSCSHPIFHISSELKVNTGLHTQAELQQQSHINSSEHISRVVLKGFQGWFEQTCCSIQTQFPPYLSESAFGSLLPSAAFPREFCHCRSALQSAPFLPGWALSQESTLLPKRLLQPSPAVSSLLMGSWPWDIWQKGMN